MATVSYTYGANHKRVYRQRGKASSCECVSCIEDEVSKQAHHWALVHGEDGTDPWADYVPMCRSCHMLYDEVGIKNEATRKARGYVAPSGFKMPDETKAKISAAKLGRALTEQHKARISASLQSAEMKIKLAANGLKGAQSRFGGEYNRGYVARLPASR